MPNAIRAAALAGRTCREQIGALPDDLDLALGWAWRELGIVADWSRILGPGRDGFCYAIPGNGTRGRVLLSEHARHPRLTLAHEVGHLMLANGAAFSMVCQQHRMLLPEQEATAFAVTFLIADRELCELFADGATVAQIARHFGIPEAAILARMQLARLLHEVHTQRLDAALARLCPDDLE
jgi:hypothetical protein